MTNDINDINDLVGKRVMHIHRQHPDYTGTVTEVLAGCNPVILVSFDGLEFPSWVPPQDLAFYGGGQRVSGWLEAA